MRYYLLSITLIIAAIFLVVAIPTISSKTDLILVSAQIPQNNAEVVGIQKYNIPPVSKNIPAPEVSSRAVFVKDLTTDTTLFQKNANESLPIASTTKVMTALVASKYFKPNSSLIVGESANVAGSKVGLSKDEDLSFRSLLYGMLLNSGNDAAFAIAENYPGGVSGFVDEMNKEAQSLGLKATHFDNPAGFDSTNHYSSASDLDKITEEALNFGDLARIFATKETSIVSLDKKYVHNLQNLNKLLSQVYGVLGVKTGYTDAAKENLVTLVEREGKRVLIVVLGSDDRFGESTKLIDWVYINYEWP